MSHKKIILVNGFDLSNLLNISVATSSIRILHLPKSNNNLSIRPQMHCILFGELGSTKSSILWEIGKNINQVPTVEFNKAHIYGSVDKQTGIHIAPMVWDARNSCMLIDEFSFIANSHTSISAVFGLLPVLEIPHIKKRVGYRCNEVNEKDNDLFLKVKDGVIECKTRFTCIINTMMDLRARSSDYIDALKSRCLVIPHYPSLDDLKGIARGNSFYEYKQIKTEKIVKLSEKSYNKILGIVDANIKNPDAYLRVIGDCCRAFAVLRKHDEHIYKTISKLHETT